MAMVVTCMARRAETRQIQHHEPTMQSSMPDRSGKQAASRAREDAHSDHKSNEEHEGAAALESQETLGKW